MRIRRLSIRGFGNLKGEFIFSSDRCNLVLEPNESGKSTLAAAILAGLYGLPRQRSSAQRLRVRERHRPWSGEAFGLEMELECRGRALSIERDFARDLVVVRDGRTGRDVTAEFSQGKDALDVGEALCGLGRDEFVRCCFVAQHDIEDIRDAAGLTAALQRAASSQQGDVAAGEALDVLSRSLQEYRGTMLGKGKVDNEIRRLDAEIERLGSELAAMTARRLQSEDRIRQLEEATRREGRTEQDLAQADDLHLLAAREESRAALDQALKDIGELAGYRREMEELAPFAAFPSARLGRLREIKGELMSLSDRGAAATARLDELERLLKKAESDLEAAGPHALLPPEVAADAASCLAVLRDLWRQRIEKRRAFRREARRLRAGGLEPDRAADLARDLEKLSEEDRLFVGGHRERLLEVKADLAVAEKRRDRLKGAEESQRLIVPLAAHRGKERAAQFTLALGIVLTAIFALALQNKLPIIATVLMAFAGLLWWFWLLEKRPVHGAEEFGSELQRLQTEIWGHEKEIASLQERLLRLAMELEYPSPEALVEDFKELERLRSASVSLTTHEAALRDARERYVKAAEEMKALMERAGEPVASLPGPRRAGQFVRKLSHAARAQASMERLKSERQVASEERATVGLRDENLRLEAERDAEEAFGQDARTQDLDALLSRFEEAGARRERLERLRDEIVPAIERRHNVPPERTAERLQKELEVLSRQAGKVEARRTGMPSLSPERTSREYAEDRRLLQEEIRGIQAERIRLSEELADVLRESRRDLPLLQEQIQECRRALARATAFRDAVSLAMDVLGRQSHEAYAEWADALNQKAGGILHQLSPDWGDVRFDTDLSFTVKHIPTGRTLDSRQVDGHASSGARDQIHLAVRLAVSEYLSAAGVHLPFILDDPFVAFDDERFSRAMEFLLDELGRHHQIIVLSCHEARHRQWQGLSPAPLADRVRVIDLTPLST
ncbi:MAG: AAA family ATPase [Candidatus Polarisedimenticolia bacterium]